MLLNWYRERTKNKAVFVKQMENFYRIVGAKYIDVKASQVQIQVDEKTQTFQLTGSDLFNVHGKRLYIVDLDSQKNLLFEDSEQKPILSAKELDGFLGGGFITGVLSALEEKKFDIISLAMGIVIGALLGLTISNFIG